MLSNTDLLEGVDDWNLNEFVDEEIFGGDLPLEDDEWNINNVPDPVEDNDLDVDKEVDQSGLADLLEDSRLSS